MESEKIIMLSQLVNSLHDVSLEFDKAYNAHDKKKFDKSKQAILDFQKKIEIILKEK